MDATLLPFERSEFLQVLDVRDLAEINGTVRKDRIDFQFAAKPFDVTLEHADGDIGASFEPG